MARTGKLVYGCKIVGLVFIIALIVDLYAGDVDGAYFLSEKMRENLTSELRKPIKDSDQGNFDLIISSYMRSGSTFLGRIFSIRPDTFYVFEPLWNAQTFAFYTSRRDVCHYTQNRCSRQGQNAVTNNIGSNISLRESIAYLNGLFDCTFNDYERFLPDPKRFPKEFPDQEHSWNFAKGTIWEPYYTCASLDNSTYKQCFSLMKTVCQGAKHKVFKILRMSLNTMEALLNWRKNLKIVHLFRDPRGIINSHLNTKFYQKKIQAEPELENDIKTMCIRMKNDIQTIVRLKSLFADRFLVVQYEDLDDLSQSAHALYDFMGMKTTISIDNDVIKLIKPKNSTVGFHPYSYRTSLPWETERLIDKHCNHVFKALGYPVFRVIDGYKNVDLTNTNPLPYTLKKVN